MSPTTGNSIYWNRGALWSSATGMAGLGDIYSGETGEVFNVPGFTSGTNLLARENLLDVVQNINPVSSPLVQRLRSGNRSRYIEDNNGICMCYKHRRIWREGADFKKGRRPCDRPGGACRECFLKVQI